MADLLGLDPARTDRLILVDALDRPLGTASKEEAHRDALLHRALSVVLIREGTDGLEVLLSRRADNKYHSGGLWANSVCSHPRAGEDTLEAARRRVPEELGCEVTKLTEISAFCYRAAFADRLTEFEYDHVFVGMPKGAIVANPAEVSEVQWVSVDEVATRLAAHPDEFSAWAPMVLSLTLAWLGRQPEGWPTDA